MGGSDIKVTPAALGAAVVTIRSTGERVRETSVTVSAPAGPIVGDPACAQALSGAQRLISEAVLSSAEGILALSRALNEAADAYALMESVAVIGGLRS